MKIQGFQGAFNSQFLVDGELMTLAQLLQTIADTSESSSGVLIPEVEIQANGLGVDGREMNVLAFWRPSSLEFLNHNPEVWLYRYKRAKIQPGPNYKVRRKKFVHPVHLDGSKHSGSNLYSGTVTDGTPFRESEWDCPQAPFQKILLDTDWSKWFSPFYRRPRQGNGNRQAEKEIFRFGIVIDNPDETTNDRFPKLHGPISKSEIVLVKNEDGIKWFMNNVPYSRRGTVDG